MVRPVHHKRNRPIAIRLLEPSIHSREPCRELIRSFIKYGIKAFFLSINQDIRDSLWRGIAKFYTFGNILNR
jgi:hypothetical protein